MERGVFYSAGTGLNALAQVYLGSQWKSVRSIDELLENIRSGASAILVLDFQDNLGEESLGIISGKPVTALGLSGTQKPAGVPDKQFQTFDVNTFIITIKKLAQKYTDISMEDGVAT